MQCVRGGSEARYPGKCPGCGTPVIGNPGSMLCPYCTGRLKRPAQVCTSDGECYDSHPR